MSIEEKHIIAAHAEVHTVKVLDIDPDHEERKESAEFRAAKERLKNDGHYHCYICKGTENLQSHHMAGEYKFRTIVDFNLLKEFLLEWDIYGYSRLMRNLPITTVDDIRNQMVLCLDGESLVLMADGSNKPIKKIKPGDFVIGGDGYPHKVTKTFSRLFEGELIEIAPETLATPEHPIWTSRGWVPAGQLHSDDFIYAVAKKGDGLFFSLEDLVGETNGSKSFLGENQVSESVPVRMLSMPVSTVDFHDDIEVDKKGISDKGSDRNIFFKVQSQIFQSLIKPRFKSSGSFAGSKVSKTFGSSGNEGGVLPHAIFRTPFLRSPIFAKSNSTNDAILNGRRSSFPIPIVKFVQFAFVRTKKPFFAHLSALWSKRIVAPLAEFCNITKFSMNFGMSLSCALLRTSRVIPFLTLGHGVSLTTNDAFFDERRIPFPRGCPSVDNSFRNRGRSHFSSNSFFEFVSTLVPTSSNLGVNREKLRTADDTVFPARVAFNKTPTGHLRRTFIHNTIVYDLEVESAHSFVAGGMIVHNCQVHHTGVNHQDGNGAIGIHFLPFPEWIMQKLCLPGCNPIPQKGETVEQALARVKANERKDVE